MDYLKNIYQASWQSIVKPFRYDYGLDNLGPEIRFCMSSNDQIFREDFEVKNEKNMTIKATLFHTIYDYDNNMPKKVKPRVPCVVYCHSHSGNRIEGIPLLQELVPEINLCVFDFTGSGHSDGEFTTLGMKESHDLKAIIDTLKTKYETSGIALWGRSMGAVTCIMYVDQFVSKNTSENFEDDSQIVCMLLDSPFGDIKTLIGDTMKAINNIPRWVTGTALLAIGGTVKKNTGYDVLELKPVKHVKKSKIPALFMVGREDIITPPGEVKVIYEKYGADSKEYFLIDGEHHETREDKDIDYGIKFVKKYIKIFKEKQRLLLQSQVSTERLTLINKNS